MQTSHSAHSFAPPAQKAHIVHRHHNQGVCRQIAPEEGRLWLLRALQRNEVAMESGWELALALRTGRELDKHGAY